MSAKPSVPRSCSSVVIATCQPSTLLAEPVRDRHLDVVEEDLVELGLAGDLAQRPHLDAGRAHVDDQIGQVVIALVASGSLSVTRMQKSAMCANDDHTFWPFTT